MFEVDAKAFGGDRHAAHVRGVQHADQFHDAFLQVKPVGRHNLADAEAIVSRRSPVVRESHRHSVPADTPPPQTKPGTNTASHSANERRERCLR